MAKLFDTLAGRAQGADYFKIGDAEFYADPLTLLEWSELQAIPDIEHRDDSGKLIKAERDLPAWAEFMAEKLRLRVRNKFDPANVTSEWLLEHLPFSWINTLDYVLMYGRVPDAEKK